MGLVSGIEAIVNDLDDLKDRLEVIPVARYEKDQKQRIFEDGQCTNNELINSRRKAKNLDPDNQYGVQQGRRRRNSGRRVSKVDLEFTGSLRKSLVTGRDAEGSLVYGFDNERSRKIAQGHEEYREKEIFGASESEVKNIKDTSVEVIREWLREKFR